MNAVFIWTIRCNLNRTQLNIAYRTTVGPSNRVCNNLFISMYIHLYNIVSCVKKTINRNKLFIIYSHIQLRVSHLVVRFVCVVCVCLNLIKFIVCCRTQKPTLSLPFLRHFYTARLIERPSTKLIYTVSLMRRRHRRLLAAGVRTVAVDAATVYNDANATGRSSRRSLAGRAAAAAAAPVVVDVVLNDNDVVVSDRRRLRRCVVIAAARIVVEIVIIVVEDDAVAVWRFVATGGHQLRRLRWAAAIRRWRAGR